MTVCKTKSQPFEWGNYQVFSPGGDLFPRLNVEPDFRPKLFRLNVERPILGRVAQLYHGFHEGLKAHMCTNLNCYYFTQIVESGKTRWLK